MGTSTMLMGLETVRFTYSLQDQLGNEWLVEVMAVVSMGSKSERDELGNRYDGDEPSVQELKMYWSFSKGKDASVLHKSFMPNQMLAAIETHAICMANEQAFQQETFH